MRFNAGRWASKNNLLFNWLNKIVNNCDIDPYVKVPKSIKLMHSGSGIVIGRGVRIGENVMIYHNVTLGTKNIKNPKEEEYPQIGNNVLIGAGSIILGGIKIGENSIIGAGSYIDKDIPENCIAYSEKKLVIKKR